MPSTLSSGNSADPCHTPFLAADAVFLTGATSGRVTAATSVHTAQSAAALRLIQKNVAWSRIKPPTTVIVGTLDKTVFGRQQTPASLRQFLQAIPIEAPGAVARMPNGTLLRLDGLGHSPHVEDPARFEKTLLSVVR